MDFFIQGINQMMVIVIDDDVVVDDESDKSNRCEQIKTSKIVKINNTPEHTKMKKN